MLQVDIGNTTLKVSLKGQAEPLVQGTFHKRVHLDDTLWAIDDGSLVLDICKDNKMEWWKCVLQGDPEINTQKVQPENSKLGDLDGETRQVRVTLSLSLPFSFSVCGCGYVSTSTSLTSYLFLSHYYHCATRR